MEWGWALIWVWFGGGGMGAYLKSALGGSFEKTVKNSKSSLWFKTYHG